MHSGRHLGQALVSIVLCTAAFLPLALPCAAAAEPVSSDWSSYFGNEKAWSYSGLDQIDRGNVATLRPAWIFPTGAIETGLSSTPLVIDSIMYLPTQQNQVFALDAATGHVLWSYKEKPAEGRNGPRRPLSLAAGFGMLFMGTSDYHLVALDQKTGHEVWNVEISDPRQCGCGPSVAPLLVQEKLIIGSSSNDTGHRGFIDAYEAKTGKFLWRFWTSAGPGEPGHDTWPGDLWRWSTGSTWLVGSYDPELDLVYWGVGNPGPMLGGDYPGDKLYSDSVVALDPDTGKLKWYYQHLPNDKLDYDSVLEPVLIDRDIDGKARKLLVQPTKSGFTYVLDRATGAFIRGYPFAEQINWTKGLDAKTGHPLEPRLTLQPGIDTTVCPGIFGARAIGHSSYSPHTGLWYNSSYETCTIDTAVAGHAPQEAIFFNAASFRDTRIPPGAHPFTAAFDPVTGTRKWTYPTHSVNVGSLLSTAGDLVFGGDVFGNAWALDAVTGKQLWSFDLGAGISSAPISFAVAGRQYVAMAAGLSPVATALTKEVLTAEEIATLPPGGALLAVFALPEAQEGVAP
jgi:alcohol dehydrogenase (cytochrome c)